MAIKPQIRKTVSLWLSASHKELHEIDRSRLQKKESNDSLNIEAWQVKLQNVLYLGLESVQLWLGQFYLDSLAALH